MKFMRGAGRIMIATAIFSCGTMIATAANGSLVPESTASAAQQAIIRLENRWLANEDNPAVLESILAEDFVHVVPVGIISKQENIGFVRSHPNTSPGKHKFERLQVRVYGSVAIANGIVVAEIEGKGQRRTLFTDVFAFRNGRWQAVNAQETPAADNAAAQRP